MAILLTIAQPPPPASPGELAASERTSDGGPDTAAELRLDDPRQFRAFFEAHSKKVWRFLRDILGDDAAADEATQETFVRAHARRDQLRDKERLVPWLFGIARHVSWEHSRARRRTDPLPDALDTLENPDPAPSPEARMLTDEADRHLATALAELGEERRTALVLRIDHGLGYDEIAQVMGWPLHKVKNEIHRARLQLRTRLSEYLGTAEGESHGV